MQFLPELKSMSLQEKLLKILGNQVNAQQCISHIMTDRVFFDRNQTYHFVKNLITDYTNSYGKKMDFDKATPQELEQFAKRDPVAFLIFTIIYEHEKSNIDSTTQRELAFDSYQSCFKDESFGRHFFYSRSLLPVLTYLLIMAGIWKPAGNDTIEETIGEQVMGVYKGSVSFSKGQIIPENIRHAVLGTAHEKVDKEGRVIEWFASSPLDDGIENRLNRFYIPSRREIQKEIVSQYQQALAETSESIATLFKNVDKNVLIVIGPYGCGKSTFLRQTYGLEESKSKLVSLSVDTLKSFFASATTLASTHSDYHFEVAILIDTVEMSHIQNLFATGAYIDQFRFNGVTRAYVDKKIQMIEIATPTIQDAVFQYCNREQSDNYQLALACANSAQQYRLERIKSLQTNEKMFNIDYKLVCNVPQKGYVDVLDITTQNALREIRVSDKLLHTALTSEYHVTGDEIESMLQQKSVVISKGV